jgi:superfamily II DNA or RNA helicase
VEDAEGIIVDECHCLAAATHLKVVMRATKAYWRYGLSATPLSRSDKKNILTVGALGPVIHHVKPSDLVEAGRVSKPIIHMIRCWQHSERKTWEGAYRECVEKSSTRNGLIVQAVGRAPKPALVFVKNIKHGRFLARQFREKGHKTKFVWGDKLGSERDSVAKDLNEGALDVAVTSVIWQEGVDIPALRTIGVATGGKSGIASLQRLGRGMRLAEGKDEFVVIDIADEGNKWTERHAHARRQAYRKTGYEVQTIRPDEIETIDALQGSRVATG